jgi:hypothetical protein
MEIKMKNKKLLILFILLVIVVSSFQVISTSAQEGDQPELNLDREAYKPSFGVEINQFYYPSTYSTALNKAEQAGNHWLRYNGLRWSDVQPNNADQWLWGNVATLESNISAASAAGMEVILVIRSTPLWAQKYSIAEGYNANYYCGPMKADNFDEFANFMVEVVNKYSQPPYNVKYFELWNEPDEFRGHQPPITPSGVFGCWGERDDPTYYGGRYYGQMLKAVYPAVKAETPGAQIVMGGLLLPCPPEKSNYCKMSNFFKGVIEEEKIAGQNIFDYANFHGYATYDTTYPTGILMERNESWWAGTAGMVEGKLNYIKQVMGSNQKPILMTEAALVDPNNLSSSNPSLFEARKADYLVFVFARNIAKGIAGSTWYHMDNHGWSKSGLLDGNNQPLPAYYAFKVLTAALDGAEYFETLSLGSGILGYEFRRGEHRIWVLFSENGSTRTINKSSIPFGIQHAFNLFGRSVTQTATAISFNRPIYIDNIPNTPPIFTSTPVTQVYQDALYSYNIQTGYVAPETFDTHTITATSPLPSWLTLVDNGDNSATLFGSPNNEQVGVPNISLTVTDSHGATAQQPFNITVINVNDPPRFTSSPVSQASAGEPYLYNIAATDPDHIHGQESLTISVIAKPDWLSFETDAYAGSGIWTARLSGTPPSQEQIDARPQIHLRVTDKDGLYVDQIFTIGTQSIYLPLIFR